MMKTADKNEVNERIEANFERERNVLINHYEQINIELNSQTLINQKM